MAYSSSSSGTPRHSHSHTHSRTLIHTHRLHTRGRQHLLPPFPPHPLWHRRRYSRSCKSEKLSVFIALFDATRWSCFLFHVWQHVCEMCECVSVWVCACALHGTAAGAAWNKNKTCSNKNKILSCCSKLLMWFLCNGPGHVHTYVYVCVWVSDFVCVCVCLSIFMAIASVLSSWR